MIHCTRVTLIRILLTMNERPATPFPLRMPAEMREQLEAAASTAGRSLNAEIIFRLGQVSPPDQQGRPPASSGWAYDMVQLAESNYELAKKNTRAMFLASLMATFASSTQRLVDVIRSGEPAQSLDEAIADASFLLGIVESICQDDVSGLNEMADKLEAEAEESAKNMRQIAEQISKQTVQDRRSAFTKKLQQLRKSYRA